MYWVSAMQIAFRAIQMRGKVVQLVLRLARVSWYKMVQFFDSALAGFARDSGFIELGEIESGIALSTSTW
jgi:hypothetical protein